MKNIITLVILLLFSYATIAQVPSTYFEGKDAFNLFPALRHSKVQELTTKRMPPVDVEKLLKEDIETEGLDIPYRFGYGFDVNYTMNDGIWEEQGTERIWSLKIESLGAYSLNFIFDELRLATGAQLYIFNTEGSMVYGPVTEEQNLTNGIFLTDLVAGDEVIIQISEPAIDMEKSVLKITRVVHAYKNTFPFSSGSDTRATILNCHNDVECHPAWSQESDGVALILLHNGEAMCTGSLLNNTAQDFRPYILTAFHCIDTDNLPNCTDGVLSINEISNAEDWMFRFQYKKTTCNGSAISSTLTYNHAYFRSAWRDTDFALMELRSNVNSDRIKFLGWDQSGNSSTTGTVIHHPSGDPMKISFDNHSLSMNNNTIPWDCNYFLPINTHWVVGLDNGTTEGGSSGAPLFDTNHRVIGQNHGGGTGCPPITKFFGSLQQSWTSGGTNTTSLSYWLDPVGTNQPTIDGIYFPSISGPSLFCSNSGPQTFTVINPPPVFTWSVSPNLTLTGSGNSVSISPNGTGSGSVRIMVGSVTVVSKDISIGPPIFYEIDGPASVDPDGTPHTYYANYYGYGGVPTSYSWSVGGAPSSSWYYINTSGGSTAQISFYGEATYYVWVTMFNACGSSGGQLLVEAYNRQSPAYIVYPNPVNDILSIEIQQTISNANKPLRYDIHLYDIQGNLVRNTTTTKAGTVQIDISGLPDGNYFLHIYDGVDATPFMKQIVVKH